MPGFPPSAFHASRRRLVGALAGLAGAAMLPGRARAQIAAGAPQALPAPATAPAGAAQALVVPYLGRHQAGVVTPQPYAGLFAAFDILADTRAELAALLALLTERVAFLTQGGEVPVLDPSYPPSGSGILGPKIAPERLTITLAVGASVFDGRFGLSALRPPELIAMPAFPNDALDADLCHGDLMVQICAETPEETLHALRDIIKQTPDQLSLRWKQEGFAATHGARSGPLGTGRNMLGFKDGTANADPTDAAKMRALVWTGAGGATPAWAQDGTYMAVRLIRNYVERWDRTPLSEQERIFGRDRDRGAPLGMTGEFDDPRYGDDPKGERIRLDSHIRLANPKGERGGDAPMIRRGYNYSNGVTKSGQLDMGLIFVSFQSSLDKGFLAVQARLNGEALEEYIKPYGGGFFYVLPGVEKAGDSLGQALLAAADKQQTKG